jgi:hypothetical protein
MKKSTLTLVSILLAIATYSQQVSLIYSTDLGKNCFIRINPGKIYDNKFDVDFQVNWVSNEMQPVKDQNSVVCFDASKIWVSQKDFVSLASGEKIISFNSTKRITFNVSEEFLGDTIELKFPFKYAPSEAVASSAADQVEFSFKRPRVYKSYLAVSKGEIIDKTAPVMTLLLPEGVNEGNKPIVEIPFVTVRVKATDFYGISTVMVNNTLANQIDDSIYEVEIPLKVGYENKVTTVVTDKSGFTAQKEFPIECRKSYTNPQYMAAVGAQIAVAAAEKTQFYADVDTGIPVNFVKNEMRYALIFGNEDYTTYQSGLETEMNVEFAVRDAEVFKEYAEKVLAIPSENIIFLKNAKVLDMKRALTKFNAVMKNTKGQGDFFIYYAGHGFPDEITKEPYLMPVDVGGSDLEFAIKLTNFYKDLSTYPSKRVTIFLDACFSGGGREMGLLAARGVKIKPKENQVAGNLVVFSASSGEQSSLPYKDKQHGIFTYYLLQKLKETKGDITYEQLGEYLSSTVGIRSLMVNNKEQSPQVNISKDVVGIWKNWKMVGE